MTSIFDGMAGVLSDVLGAPVTVTPQVGSAVTVQALFRREPIEVAGDDGEAVLILAPTLRVRRDLLPALARGDLVAPSIAPGESYRVINQQLTASPASDGFVIVELEQVDV